MKDKIIWIALQQFLRHGIRKTTVQKLIIQLGISTKTFYKYFNDKEDVLRHCLTRHYAGLSDQLVSLQNETNDPIVALVKLWHQAIELDFGVNHIFYHDLNHYYPELQDSVLQKFSKKTMSFLNHLTANCIRKGYLRKEIVPVLIPEVISILYSSITRTGRFKQFGLSTRTLMQNTIVAYIRGICTEKGLKVLNKNKIVYRSTIK